MKKILFLTVLLLSGLVAAAQVRSAADIDSRTFVIGLDNYFVGSAGALGFSTAGRNFQARLSDHTVTVLEEGTGEEKELYRNGLTIPFSNSYAIPNITGDFVIGVHDFTGDQQPELVIAVRDAAVCGVEAFIIRFNGNRWVSIGEIGAIGNNISECRIFRQAITIKNPATGALYSWTCHGERFDFKASDGTRDPSTLL